MDENHLTKPFWFANVWTFFPELGIDELEINYLQWRALQRTFAQMAQPCLLKQVLDRATLETIPREIAGICLTFHHGPYRLLPRYLMAAGYKITILLSPKIIGRESRSAHNDLLMNNLPQDTLQYIDTSRPTAFKNMISAVQERRIVLLYLDADEGLRRISALNHQALIKVPIRKGELYFHSNSARFAHKFGIPVSFMWMERDNKDGRWKIAITNKLAHRKNESVSGYLKRFKMKLATALKRIMGQNWTAWENWPLLHLYQPDLTIAADKEINEPIWMMPIAIEQGQFFFDVKNRRFFEIKKD